MGKRKPPNAELTVKAADCYDPVDYYMVHKVFFDGMRAAIREAHGRITVTPAGACLCIYCQSPVPTPAEPR
jgi:hypothetical protein